jgi:hypothetical protein
MGIESVQEAQATADMVADRSGHRYNAPYVVKVSDARVTPLEIVEYFGNTLKRGLDSPFRYADASDPFSYCDSIAPRRRTGSTNIWDVILAYSTPTAKDDENEQDDWTDEDGNPTRDPFAWKGDMSIATQYVQVPVWKAWNVDAFPIDSTTGTYHRSAETLGPVVNSAGIVLDPPLTVDYPERVIQITKNVPDWSETTVIDNENHINGTSKQFAGSIVRDFNAVQHTYYAYEIKCTSIQGRYAEVADADGSRVRYWKCAMEFRIRMRSTLGDPFDGWLETVLDRGLTRGGGVGDPDGTGGQYASGDLESGMARAAPVRGPDGDRIGELVLLDGTGQPLTDLTGSDAQDGVYCRWRVNPVSNFDNLPFPVFS